jgi:hypothetical protein
MNGDEGIGDRAGMDKCRLPMIAEATAKSTAYNVEMARKIELA